MKFRMLITELHLMIKDHRMPEWFYVATDSTNQWDQIEIPLTRVALSIVAGFLAALVYGVTFGRKRKDARSLYTTLVLLSVLVAVVIQVIGDNAARAFGLVGALSIVRFRTVVEDTADTAFVIFAVTLGMAIGAGYGLLALICIPAIALVSGIMSLYNRPRENSSNSLTIRLALGSDPDLLVLPVFEKHLAEFRRTATGTAKQGAALELVYSAKLKAPLAAVAFINELSRVEGVQGVEMK
jgi:hypothetical protein